MENFKTLPRKILFCNSEDLAPFPYLRNLIHATHLPFLKNYFSNEMSGREVAFGIMLGY
jgi:hypothetical protein